MRRLARWIGVGLLLGLGCSTQSTPPSVPLKVAGQERTLAVAFDDIPAEIAASVPLSLTASDGTGLKLVALKARAVIDDPLAFTEMHLTFENPEPRVLEGTFSIVLPQGAAISRFAMKNDAGFMEGEVVEKQQARRAYEDFLHRRQDPALLEQAAGNEFSARVFPIPAQGKKELIVSFSQELSKRSPYVLPLKGLPEIGSIDVEAYAAGKAAPVGSLVKQGIKPEGDFRVDARLLGERAGIRNGNLVLARVTPIVSSQPEPLGSTLILMDTSASRALGAAEQGRIVKRLCASIGRSIGPKTPVVIAAYDQTIEPVFDGAASSFSDAVLDQLRQRLALGASNLEAALGWASERARTQSISRVILVTDGVATAGQTEGDKLRHAVQSLKDRGVLRLDAIALGGIRDDDLLKSLVNAGLPRGGVVLDPTSIGEEEMWRRLNEATRSGIEVKVEGAAFTFPQKVDGVQAGDEVLVYANVPNDNPVRISVGGGPFAEMSLIKVERPLLERAWVGAKIKSLVERERVDGASPELSKEIVALSTQYRVLSPKTSLLVLESDWDYQRFGIDRRALADILVTEGGRISLLHRTLPDPPKPQVVVEQNRPKPKPVAKSPPAPRPTSTTKPTTATAKTPATKASKRGFDIDGFGGGGSSAGGSAGASAPRAPAARPSAAPAAPAAARPRLDPSDSGGAEKSKEDSGLGRIGTIGHGAGASPGPAASAAPANGPPSQADRGYGYELSGDPQSPPASAAAVRDTRSASRPSTPAREPEGSAAEGRAGGVPGGVVGGAVGGSLGGAVAAPESPDIPLADPYLGPFKAVMDLVKQRRAEDALRAAFEWRKKEPGDVMALVALGEAFEAAGDSIQAARCYGSIVDLFPGRADLRRFAGERLERLAPAAGLALAADTFGKAEIERPDHPASHRLFAYALVKQGKHEQAFEAIVRGVRQPYPGGRFRGVTRILAEDLGLIGAAWAKAEPKRAEEIFARVRSEGGSIEDQPSLRFVLNWETDANDVDFHIYDAKGGHAFYSQPALPSGGELYADVTTGYGPECFTIRGPAARRAGPYTLQAHYYSRGPMGYGMGKLEVIEHDGRGGLTFEERPFIVMLDHAFVNLGTVAR